MNNTPKTLFADGFDSAIIGITSDRINGIERVVYDAWKMVDILVKRDGMKSTEALEYLEFNTFTAYVSEGTPIYVDVITREEIEQRLEEQ
ncbi:MAG: hypothetical protein GOVbin4318_25 [Prokaryotic dsDNA virus sp.]|nr:MAG: hypothetical protein GOVbin4318_25 [Prokaryotic dsDNA virus sp.]|tara:strand:+ start:24587 stop:24856 length:270 start_codon:yes stop_codon:yes gene_type:complete